MGLTCGPAYIEMPYSDIIVHPEYSRFQTSNSLALVKLLRPLKSHYMVPICLPTVLEREKQRKEKAVFMIDYISAVPTDFEEEKMAKKTLKLYTHKDCRRHRYRSDLPSDGVTHALCSSGCGIRAGTPIISHVVSGAFELIGIAAYSGPCLSIAMRTRLNQDPPVYIDIFPYVAWITNVVMANLIPSPYPQRFQLTSGKNEIRRVFKTTGSLRQTVPQKQSWSKSTYMVGNWCFMKRKKLENQVFFFYSEIFEVTCDMETRLTVVMKISAGVDCVICCLRMKFPNRMTVPKVIGIGTYNITIEFQTQWFPYDFHFQLGLTGKNSTSAELNSFISEIPQPGYWF